MSQADDADDHVDGTRRDFLYIATAATGAVVAGAAVWPLIDQMNPAQNVLALASVEVPVDGVEVGTQLLVKWRGKPVFIRREKPETLAKAAAVPMEDLKDPIARNANAPDTAPATLENRVMGGKDGDLVVQLGVCTHLGCVPIEGAGEYGGWFCPCHGSVYDVLGRIRHGPAPQNLHIPEATFVSDTVIKLG